MHTVWPNSLMLMVINHKACRRPQTSGFALQIIFLDSDNVAVADPAALFTSAAYLDKGAVLWPDYWASTAAPDLQRILPAVTLPANTFESGQMVFNKRRCTVYGHNCCAKPAFLKCAATFPS